MAEKSLGVQIADRVDALTPEEKHKLGAALTPEIAAIVAKVLGEKTATILQRAQTFRDPTTASPPVERFANVLGKT